MLYSHNEWTDNAKVLMNIRNDNHNDNHFSKENLSPILLQDYHCITHQRTIIYLFSSIHTWSQDQLCSIKVLLVFCMSHVDSLILRKWTADAEMHDRQEAPQIVLRNCGLAIGPQVILEVYVVEDWNKIHQCKRPHVLVHWQRGRERVFCEEVKLLIWLRICETWRRLQSCFALYVGPWCH